MTDRVAVDFDSWVGGGNGADSLGFEWGATIQVSQEDHNNGGYMFAMDEYGDHITFTWQNNILKRVGMSNLDDSQWHSWTLEFKNNHLKVFKDGSLVLEHTDSQRTISPTGFVGFGARTGGSTNEHRIKNFRVYTPI